MSFPWAASGPWARKQPWEKALEGAGELLLGSQWASDMLSKRVRQALENAGELLLGSHWAPVPKLWAGRRPALW